MAPKIYHPHLELSLLDLLPGESSQINSLVFNIVCMEQGFSILLSLFSFSNENSPTSLVHVTCLSNSKFLVCAYLDAFTDIILPFMNVRRNWKVFSFCVKQAAINFFICACARAHVYVLMCMHLCMYMYIDAHMAVCVHSRMACWFVHVCSICTSTYSKATSFPLYLCEHFCRLWMLLYIS